MKIEIEFHVKIYYSNGFTTVDIRGKNLGDAFYKYYMRELKHLRTIIGFELTPNV